MLIKRVRVEEGFLDGLDLELSLGLNTVIGARGTGKTSLIELIRFTLGAESYSSETAETSQNQAVSVLGSGRVVVTIDEDGELTDISRTASDDFCAILDEPPLIFSQTEIENVGLHASSRLRLLDGFLERPDVSTLEEEKILAIRSASSDVWQRLLDIEVLRRETSQLPLLQEDLKKIEPQEKAISETSAEAAEKSNTLESHSKKISALEVAKAEAERFQTTLEARSSGIERLLSFWSETEQPPSSASGMSSAYALASSARQKLEMAKSDLNEAIRKTNAFKSELDKNLREVGQEARELRIRIDQIQEGAGLVSSQAQAIRTKIARLEALEDVLAEKLAGLARARSQRDALLDELEEVRTEKFAKREAVATRLNEKLGPRIQVSVERAGHSAPYAATIVNSLRGSGLHYNDLSRSLAEAVSPRELAEFVENGDASSLAAAANIPLERAEKCIANMSDEDVIAHLFTLQVDDRVDFFLLDKSQPKPISQLSTGQRCTVVLPIVLERRNRVLIVDQPEDHIDNAFITDTLIKAISDRSNEDQVILSTHNANIPVLGDASLVVQLESDGKRGFVEVSEPLSHPRAVNAITTIMEGGREAFEKRAAFYHEHP